METDLEQILTSCYKADMISYMAAHPEAFEEALELAVADNQPYSWRAAWLLWSCMEANDLRIQRSVKKIMDAITSKKDGHQRELLKLLLLVEVDEEYEGLLFDVCMKVWEKVNKRPSVRFTAFQVILKIAKKHPGLSREITFLTQDHYLDTLSPGVRRSISGMISKADL